VTYAQWGMQDQSTMHLHSLRQEADIAALSAGPDTEAERLENTMNALCLTMKRELLVRAVCIVVCMRERESVCVCVCMCVSVWIRVFEALLPSERRHKQPSRTPFSPSPCSHLCSAGRVCACQGLTSGPACSGDGCCSAAARTGDMGPAAPT
jgi:hypothetical protein